MFPLELFAALITLAALLWDGTTKRLGSPLQCRCSAVAAHDCSGYQFDRHRYRANLRRADLLAARTARTDPVDHDGPGTDPSDHDGPNELRPIIDALEEEDRRLRDERRD